MWLGIMGVAKIVALVRGCKSAHAHMSAVWTFEPLTFEQLQTPLQTAFCLIGQDPLVRAPLGILGVP